VSLSSISRNNEVYGQDGSPRKHYSRLVEALNEPSFDDFRGRCTRATAQAEFDSFTFPLDPLRWRTVPTDWIPRIIPKDHWETISAGVEQRLRALNRFLFDLYNGDQDIVPRKVVYSSVHYNPEMQKVRPAKDVYAHIYGIDLVHLGEGRYVVLEDNLRIPSGITYQLKTRSISRQFFPELNSAHSVAPYGIAETYRMLFSSLTDSPNPGTVILTDGKLGSAFFEHRYLSELLRVPLVEGSDLFIDGSGYVHAKTADGIIKVDVIYRRVQDLEIFVPGLTEAYRKNKVILVNAMGTGVADDKLVFLWVPDMIRKYLGQEPILGHAKSYNLLDTQSRRYALRNMDSLVFKVREGYGGLGVYIMPEMGPEHRQTLSQQVIEKPQAFIAQETLDFSKHVSLNEMTGSLEERYVDLRVYAVQDGDERVTVFPGGLTRVSRPRSRITNNSSGGACKPTWVLT
jgi:uncharacterized circularly permuted ATP-grasp superfamily protein